MPSLSLRGKALLALIVVLLPMLALIVYDYFDSYQRQTEGVIDDQLRTSQAIGALVEASIDDALAIAWSFSRDPVVRTMDYRQIDPHLESLRPSLPQYDNIAVIDLEGNTVGIMSPHLTPDQPRPNATGRRYFETVKSTFQPTISEVITSRATGSPTTVVAVPMFDDAGGLTGITLAALDLDYLAQRLTTVGLLPSQAVFLTDQEGKLAFHTLVSATEWGQIDFSQYPPVQSALQGRPGRARESKGVDDDVRMVATSRTPTYGWITGVSIPAATILRPMQAELIGRLLLFAAILAFAGSMAVIASRHFVLHPLTIMVDRLRAFGQGELGQRIQLHTGDEIELLSRTFNTMADQLQRNSEERDRLLREAERRADEIDAIIGSMAEGVAIVDGEERIVRLNRAGREMLGLPPDESVPVFLADLRKTDVLDAHCRPLGNDAWPVARALRGETFSEQELIYLRPDGNWINVLFAGSSLSDEKGKVALGVCIFRDITAIRELERQREEFISVVAHDLRNAMAIVSGYATMLKRLPPESHNTVQEITAIESINNGARRLQRMVADLLDVSRLEARRLRLSKQSVDMAVLVTEIVHRSSELTKGHSVKIEVHGEKVLLDADPDRIEQVLSNLLSNAGKYSYPNTQITVDVESRLSDVLITVTNLGVGIPSESRDKIFTRWNRVRAVGEEKAEGLGLGLYIAKGLVEAHGGRIWVESKHKQYASFRFTLPRHSEAMNTRLHS